MPLLERAALGAEGARGLGFPTGKGPSGRWVGRDETWKHRRDGNVEPVVCHDGGLGVSGSKGGEAGWVRTELLVEVSGD